MATGTELRVIGQGNCDPAEGECSGDKGQNQRRFTVPIHA